MGKGKDLSGEERAIVHSKIKQFWNYDKKQIMHGKVFEIRKLSAQSGVPCSAITVKRIAGEMKLQEQVNDLIFAETGQVSGLDFTPNKKGKCGRISKLTEEVKEVNINDLGLFSSLKYHVSQICTHCCTSREEMMANVIRAFDEYPADKLEDKWACYYNSLRSVMSSLGGNDYKQAHSDGKRRRRETGTSVDLSTSLDDYDRCLAYIAE